MKKKADGLVWVRLDTFKKNGTAVTSNIFSPKYNDVPIYAVGATIISSGSQWSCRFAFAPTPNTPVSTSDQQIGARLWFEGWTGNKMAFVKTENGSKVYDSGWKTYTQAGYDANQTITLYSGSNVNNVYVYWNSVTTKISTYDAYSAEPVYFYYYQNNSPLNAFYVLIKEEDLNKILND